MSFGVAWCLHFFINKLFRNNFFLVEGIWKDGVFQATHLLAKHDEKYMPREVAEALKANGQWRPKEEGAL